MGKREFSVAIRSRNYEINGAAGISVKLMCSYPTWEVLVGGNKFGM